MKLVLLAILICIMAIPICSNAQMPIFNRGEYNYVNGATQYCDIGPIFTANCDAYDIVKYYLPDNVTFTGISLSLISGGTDTLDGDLSLTLVINGVDSDLSVILPESNSGPVFVNGIISANMGDSIAIKLDATGASSGIKSIEYSISAAIGPQGPSGIQGEIGPQGEQGLNPFDGVNAMGLILIPAVIAVAIYTTFVKEE